MILEETGIIEEGFLALDVHLRAGSGGFIDLLGVDPAGVLLLLEIERSGETELLDRIKSHHAWVASQSPFLRFIYGDFRIHPFKDPRVIVLSDSFSAAFLEEISRLHFEVKPLLYRLLQAGEETALYLEPPSETSGMEPGLIREGRADASAPPGNDLPKRADPVQVERLSPEELEAFYRYGRERAEVAAVPEMAEP